MIKHTCDVCHKEYRSWGNQFLYTEWESLDNHETTGFGVRVNQETNSKELCEKCFMGYAKKSIENALENINVYKRT